MGAPTGRSRWKSCIPEDNARLRMAFGGVSRFAALPCGPKARAASGIQVLFTLNKPCPDKHLLHWTWAGVVPACCSQADVERFPDRIGGASVLIMLHRNTTSFSYIGSTQHPLCLSGLRRQLSQMERQVRRLWRMEHAC